MPLPVILLQVSTRPSGHTHATLRAPDGRRVQWVFAPGQFNDGSLELVKQLLSHKRTGGQKHDRDV